ncbi:MAG: hypothetical protein E7231_03125 [Cellulosilyticum sp.]|nr:hypothetical protein [Cellulosilyticum sp.]
MTFYHEGRKLNYLELVETVDELVKKDILPQLEPQEVNKLYIRIMHETQQLITVHFEQLGYKVEDIKQAFLVLTQIREESNRIIWERAIELYDHCLMNKENTVEVVTFMTESLSHAMRELDRRLSKISR